jgi:C-terminal processing protease CtpA/Prc
MTRDELIQIGKLIQAIVEREVQKNTKPLLSEIKRLNSKISLLNENDKSNKQISSNSISDILSDVQKTSTKNKSTYLNGIFEDITPFDDDSEQIESILDYKLAKSNDPVSKVLNKLQTTDFKKTLQIMEQSANRHNNSQMHR